MSAINRKPDFEASFAGPGFEFDFATMTVRDNSITDNQAETGAGTNRFSGKERLKHPRLDLWGNTRAIVYNFNDQLVILLASTDANFTGSIDSIDGIINQIGPDLIQFASI